jgi:hypothetical protein
LTSTVQKFGCAVILGGMLLTKVVGQKADEYQVKAAFLCNFANFVEWPPSTYKSSSDPFTVCVLGRNPFGNVLESLAAGRSVDGHPFAIRFGTDIRRIDGCQILFVSASERLRYRSILDAVKTSSVLSVGESSDFIAEGGVVDLRVENGKVRVEIDAPAAHQRNLRVSAHLLGLSKAAR